MPEETPPKPPATRSRAGRPRSGVQRKTREEREQFVKQEAERLQARNAESSKNASAKGGTRGGRGGRGGRTGITAGAGLGDTRTRDGTGTGGVFGAGSGLRSSTRSRVLPEGYSEMLEGQSGGKVDPTSATAVEAEGSKRSGEGVSSTSRSVAGKTQDIIEVATDDEPDEPKRDIERIWLSSDEDEDAIISGKRKQRSVQRGSRSGGGLRPVRAPRTLREEEEEIAMNRKKANRALKKSDSEVHEIEDDDAMDVDEPTTLKEHPPSSPEMRRRNLKRAAGKSREVKFAAETIEERAERIRGAEDAHKLRDIFSIDRQHSAGINAEDEDDETALENGRLFLFQLPPLTPFLYDPAMRASVAEPQVKQEPGISETMSSVPTTTQQPPPQKQPSTAATGGDSSEIKKEDTAAAATSKSPPLQLEGLLTASEPTRLPGGLVGKLRVHKSGKVSLDWGGTDMEVRYGTEVDFLQDAVLVQTRKEKDKTKPNPPEDGGADAGGESGKEKDTEKEKEEADDANLDLGSAGRTYALGQVRRKMVLIPDWAKLYD